MTSSERTPKTTRVFEDLHEAVKEETTGTPVSIADFYQAALEDALSKYEVERGRLVETRPASEKTGPKYNHSDDSDAESELDDDFGGDVNETSENDVDDVTDEVDETNETELVPEERDTDWYEELGSGHDYELERSEHDWSELTQSSRYRVPVLEGLVRSKHGRVTKSDVMEIVTREFGMTKQSARNYWDELLRRDNGIRPHPMIDPRVTDRIGHIRCNVAARLDDEIDFSAHWVDTGNTDALPRVYRERLDDDWRGLLGAELHRDVVVPAVYTDDEKYAQAVLKTVKRLSAEHTNAVEETHPGEVKRYTCDRGWVAFNTVNVILETVVAEHYDGYEELKDSVTHIFNDVPVDGKFETHSRLCGEMYTAIRGAGVDGDVSVYMTRLGLDDEDIDELSESEVNEAFTEAVKNEHPDTAGEGIDDIVELQDARDALLDAVGS